MKKLATVLSFCFSILLVIPISAQDFYGAGATGRHTWGVNVKYNGDFWVGTHYNIRRFGNFGTRPLDFNIVTELKIDKGLSGAATELSVNQVYADGNDFQAGFGLGADYGIRAEFCPLMKKGEDNPCTSSLSLNVGLKPGYYSGGYAVAANVETDIVKFYFGESNYGYNKEPKEDSKVDVRIFEKIGVGAHADYTNAIKGGGRFHLTADYDYDVYIGMKNNKAWNTFYEGVEYADDSDSNSGNCTMPERNFGIRTSLSMRF